MGSKKENAKIKYLGMDGVNNKGFPMKIVEYNNSKDITVEFLGPYKYVTKSRLDRFKSGYIHNPYAPWLFDVGIVGKKYPTHDSKGIKYTKEYLTWTNMIRRCYDESVRYKNLTYYDCMCCEQWMYYENFYEWMHSQENFDLLLSIDDMSIDKDIILKGNKMYNPDNCCLVPQRVNNLLLKSNNIRGQWPIGVHYLRKNNKFVAQCGGQDNHNYLGLYSTPEEAFYVYKDFKEKQIKEIAEEEYSKGTIIKRCYDALMSYEVEITD